MATSSKPTAVHFSLVFFVMTTLILALVCYLTSKELAAKTAEANTNKDEATTNKNLLNNALGDIDALKGRLGYNFTDIGAGNGGAETVIGALNGDLRAHGREQALPAPETATVADTLQSLRAALDAANAQVATLQQGNNDLDARLAQEVTTHNNRADQLQTSQENSEAELQKTITTVNEKLSEKDTEISKWRDNYRQELVAKEQISDELNRVRDELSKEITDLGNVVDYLRDRLDQAENLSFEIPDGKIVRVDNTTRTVWINLGEQDLLRKQISFSVYTSDHRGVARGTEDIKAKIEVTNILGPQLAEARILEEDISRPIQEDDPIYTPLWTPGIKEQFSFVGVVDFDGDGKSDRELLHDIIANAGAAIEIEVNDQGVREPENGKLTVASKFLVVGGIENPGDFPGFADKQQEIQKVQEELQALEKEARRQGIRKVSFGDFLNYIGYKPQQRLFIAGEDRPNKLKAGARSTGTNQYTGNRTSTGQTSARFKKSE